ncbi:hypothetical protein [Polyangium sp. 15x6]|uniref:hypothetical protein n=1 Tax=Polyangium sp. 15x6 TaxID=3042687 RepID=UPI00249B3418|nr:hypothetical protein [Polyangium sp. 15x6]MDI3282120.1 hypothetical protein [Polyangium sp. 15x6]
MAFSEAQKTDIRFYLGYPDVYRYANPRLENAIEVVGGRPESQAKVELLLSLLANVMGANAGDPAQIDKALQNAGLKAVESADDRIEFGDSSGEGTYSSSSLNSVSDYGRMLVSALSSFMGVPIASNVFGKGGYVGDQWSQTNGMSNGFGFLMNM